MISISMENMTFVIGLISLIIGIISLIIGLYTLSDYRKRKSFEKWKTRANNYYKIIDSNEYINWRDSQLRKLYGEKAFTCIFGKQFPVLNLNIDGNVCLKDLCKEEYIEKNECVIVEGEDGKEVKMVDVDKLNIINSGPYNKYKRRLYKKYRYLIEGNSKRLNEGSIKHPNLLGFSIEKYSLNRNKEVIGIHSKLSTYRYTVYTSHIMEYELYEVYNKYGSEKDLSIEQLWKLLPYRRYVHFENIESIPKTETSLEVVISGTRRYSLLSVQSIIVYKEGDTYKTFLIKRSEDPSKISAKLGYYQFPPAGGFELFENEQIRSLETIKEHYSLESALYREYLEEIFNIKDFQEAPSDNSDPIKRIFYHQEVKEIQKMMNKGTARLELLGITIDVVTMRHTVSFALIIDDESYSQKNFCLNEEFEKKNRIKINLSEVDSKLKTHKVTQDSALLFKLFKDRFSSYIF